MNKVYLFWGMNEFPEAAATSIEKLLERARELYPKFDLWLKDSAEDGEFFFCPRQPPHWAFLVTEMELLS